jgi:hypothetical protein
MIPEKLQSVPQLHKVRSTLQVTSQTTGLPLSFLPDLLRDFLGYF